MTIYDTTYFRDEGKQAIEALLGPRSWLRGLWGSERIGPGRMPVDGFSAGFHELLLRQPGVASATLFRRDKGILVELTGPSLRASWAVPYHELSVYKSQCLSLHAGGQFLKLRCDASASKTVQALLELKARFMGDA